MASTAYFAHHTAEQTRPRPPVVCHCTVVHSQLKSRTFHRAFLPLAALGFDVRYAAPTRRNERTTGIKIIELPARDTFLRRLATWPSLLKKLLRQKADLYHFQDPQLLPLAFVMKLVFRKRVVYDAYEDFPSIAASKKSVPALIRPTLAAVIAFVERLAAYAFDAVITADPITLRRFAHCGKSKKLVFYNFPNLAFFPAPRFRHPSFDLVYRGGISERTGSFVLLEALQFLAAGPTPPRLLLIGYFDSVEDENSFRERLLRMGLSQLIEIRGRIDHQEMARALGEARIGLSPLLAVPKFQKNIPVKIFEYWACGLPVIASNLSPVRPFVRDREAGLLVHPGSATEMAEAIAWLLNHSATARRMGARGRELVAQRFNNAEEVQKLRRLFERVANSSNGGHSQPCSNPS